MRRMKESQGGRYERYVAIGDSSTEGLDDPDGKGGFRGWANRLAERIASTQGGLLYANLAVRGRRTGQIREEQLEPALALRPDLATLFCGTNDVVARRFDLERVAADYEAMLRALTGTGTTVLTFTMPDLSRVLPLAGRVAPRLEALNRAMREAAQRTGARLVDFSEHPVAGDPRLWSDDRLHANSAGHARIAWALGHALGLPGADGSWAEPLPPAPRPTASEWLGAELAWTRRHLLPWLLRHARGRSSGDGRRAKRPALAEVGSIAAGHAAGTTTAFSSAARNSPQPNG